MSSQFSVIIFSHRLQIPWDVFFSHSMWSTVIITPVTACCKLNIPFAKHFPLGTLYTNISFSPRLQHFRRCSCWTWLWIFDVEKSNCCCFQTISTQMLRINRVHLIESSCHFICCHTHIFVFRFTQKEWLKPLEAYAL